MFGIGVISGLILLCSIPNWVELSKKHQQVQLLSSRIKEYQETLNGLTHLLKPSLIPINHQVNQINYQLNYFGVSSRIQVAIDIKECADVPSCLINMSFKQTSLTFLDQLKIARFIDRLKSLYPIQLVHINHESNELRLQARLFGNTKESL